MCAVNACRGRGAQEEEAPRDEEGPPVNDDAIELEGTETPSVPIPEDGLILLPLRNFVAFPGTVFPLSVGRARTMAAVEQAIREDRKLGIVLQHDPHEEEPGEDELHKVGCVAEILRFVEGHGDGSHLICRGIGRFRLDGMIAETPFLVARVEMIPEVEADRVRPETEARFQQLRALAVESLTLMPDAPEGLAATVAEMRDPAHLADLAAAYSDSPVEERQKVLETIDLNARVKLVTKMLKRRVDVLRISREIGDQTRVALEGRQRELILREQLAAIRRELGETEHGVDEDIAELTAAIEKVGMPEDVEAQVMRELARYEQMQPATAESALIRTWIDWMIELPWAQPADVPVDLDEARKILDADHYGLKKVKTRIVEYLAVRRLAPEGKAPILCFVGPPGVGKTSLGKSIAHALHRPFARLSLGGVHDEAEIRGHRRTYVGAMPGMVIQQLRRAGARNCVLMLDEIDKLGHGVGGDPAAALLEVLDPAQNTAFRDNYLGVDYDLSHVVFLTTANALDTIPLPLRDRMEIISLPGYLEEEKLRIAKRYLVRNQRAATGLGAGQVRITDAALTEVIRHYTREAGVRGLERQIGALLRHAAVAVVEGREGTQVIGKKDVAAILGPRRFENEVAARTNLPGVATGLAWTPVGGDILFVEASRMPGKGKLVLTGQLGDVMRESAQAALTLVKGRAGKLGLAPEIFETEDFHIHVPAGATPKDGPSAGVAIFAALASLLIGRKLRSDTAMTGEISLRGLVLPVGGIREKVVAAAAAGIMRVLLPARNRHDYEDIPEAARKSLSFVWLESVEDVLEAALEKAGKR
jgi:ATP-dependent Lon protease